VYFSRCTCARTSFNLYCSSHLYLSTRSLLQTKSCVHTALLHSYVTSIYVCAYISSTHPLCAHPLCWLCWRTWTLKSVTAPPFASNVSSTHCCIILWQGLIAFRVVNLHCIFVLTVAHTQAYTQYTCAHTCLYAHTQPSQVPHTYHDTFLWRVYVGHVSYAALHRSRKRCFFDVLKQPAHPR